MTRKFELLALFLLFAGSPCALADGLAGPGWGRAATSLADSPPDSELHFAGSRPAPSWLWSSTINSNWPAPAGVLAPSTTADFPYLCRLPQPPNWSEADWLTGTTFASMLPGNVMARDAHAVARSHPLELNPPSFSSLAFRNERSPGRSDVSEVWTVSAPQSMTYLFPQDNSAGVFEQLPPGDMQATGMYVMPELQRWPVAARLGWWSTSLNGSPIKVGEYQSLKSSLFWDVDRIMSNGVRTLDFSLTGLDDEATQLGLRYIGPHISAGIDYQRFLRRLDHDPLSEFVDFDQQPAAPLPAPPANFRDMKEDLTVGDDFAIRVQELDANFKGRLTKNVDWRLNVWGMRKHGERQVTALGHCFTAPNATDVNGNPVAGVACHVLSQRQRIDWLTMEVEPVIEGQFGPVSVEYSRVMRSLTTDDQVTTRPYDDFGFNGDLPYASVPENLTQIDRLKFGVNLADRRSAYARLFIGNTENKFRDTNRRFRGFDVRMTDRSVEGVSVTGYAKNYVQKGERPTFLLPLESAATIRTPIGYDRTTLGFRGRWRPFVPNRADRGLSNGTPYYRADSLSSGVSFSGGYEYRKLNRSNALFAEQVLTVDQSSTTANVAHLRAEMRWSPQLDTFVGYRVGIMTDPLYGVPIRNTTTNTNLPTEEHLIDFGATWSPANTMLLSATFGINNSGNTSNVASFQEDDYNIAFSGWYAPVPKLTVSGGLAFYANWIDQDITLGSKSTPITLPWSFGGRSDVVNVGTTYAWTERLTVSGGYEFVRSSDIAEAPVPYADIPPLSNVVVEISRFTAGVDYELRQGIGSYLRYQFFDYEDRTQSYNSGTSDMLLFGVQAVY